MHASLGVSTLSMSASTNCRYLPMMGNQDPQAEGRDSPEGVLRLNRCGLKAARNGPALGRNARISKPYSRSNRYVLWRAIFPASMLLPMVTHELVPTIWNRRAAKISASPCNCSAEVTRVGRARFRDRDYPLSGFAHRGDRVENMMRQIALVCAALGIFVSPASAQQTPPEQAVPQDQQASPNEPASPTEQSMPEAAQPPSTPQTEPLPPPPPPFPPMPRARPSHRWVDLGETHKSRSHRHSARTHRQHTKHRQHANKRSRAAQPTSRMTRRCLSMSLRQAMRQTTCRSLMRHNLQSSAPRHHASARRHNAAHHRHRHRAKRRRS